jgi:hypothetical protein
MRQMKPPGVKAKKHGTTLKRGAATQVMTYPRPKSKAVLVEASRQSKRSLSSFMIMSALKEAAFVLGHPLADLGIPEDELKQYV